MLSTVVSDVQKIQYSGWGRVPSVVFTRNPTPSTVFFRTSGVKVLH